MVEFSTIPGLGENSQLQVLAEDYNDREIRIHVRRVRDLVCPSRLKPGQVQSSTEVSAPSYFSDIVRSAYFPCAARVMPVAHFMPVASPVVVGVVVGSLLGLARGTSHSTALCVRE